jgi:hypothetical protein
MNEEEYEEWERHARLMLNISGKYWPNEVNEIIGWFRHIDGAAERGLLGDGSIDAFLVFIKGGQFNLYDSLMSRLFIYAPMIVKEYHSRE